MAKNNAKNHESVNVSAATLNCIAKALSSPNGTDLSSIIDDVSKGLNQNRDLTAINVGLTFKGITPDIDTTVRRGTLYEKQYTRYEFVSYSLIMDKVTVKSRSFKKEDNGEWKMSDYENEETFSLDRWNNLDYLEEK